ncbi:MAG: multiheme c-type cytochrome [Stappiaceae bacterium]
MKTLLLFLTVVWWGTCTVLAAEMPAPSPPDYVGSKICAECHADAASAWGQSHHANAWLEPDDLAILGDFNNRLFTHKGRSSRFFKEEGTYFIETEDVGGEPVTYEVKGVAGIAPLQQYLIETEPGRLQAFDVAWDHELGRWYHLYPEQDLDPQSGFHWTGAYKNWNGRCASCHATGYQKNYDRQQRRYESTQSEIGVGCEACHGPGAAHVSWARQPDKPEQAGLPKKGLVAGFSKASPEAEIQLCAGCHSRRSPLEEGSALPGTPFHDSYRLGLLRPGLYHPDGTILDEVYVYGSFLQSKMHQRGVRCSNCHEPHSATLKAQGNAVCTQCHSPAGNSEFPTLKKALYDAPDHHFHAAGSEGGQCVACHMTERTYMGIDARRDHSFRVPRPDLSVATGAPNTCTDCHSDKEAGWAAAELEKRFPDSPHRGDHFSTVFAKVHAGTGAEAEELLAIADYKALPGIVRASALDFLRPLATEEVAAKVAGLVEDKDPLVRAAAVTLQQAAPPVERFQRIVGALEDPMKSVRIAAARQLLGLPIAYMPQRYSDVTRSAMGDWQSSLQARADFPETHMVNGQTAIVLNNIPAALAAFREAAHMDPQLVDARAMVGRLLFVSGEREAALKEIEDALVVNPGNQELLQLEKRVRNGELPR